MTGLGFFDAHCDTIQKVVGEGADFLSGTGLHVTLPGMIEADVCAQVFAAWALTSRLNGREDEVAMKMVQAVAALCREHPDRLVLARGWTDIEAACAGSGRVAAVPSLEGADPLKGDPGALGEFHEAGVRLVTLAWDDNPFSGTAFGSGSGLTEKGRELVECCESLGVVVDVSHASDQAFQDVCSVATRPFLASHSNCRSLCPSPRNLTDDMIRELGERGGVMGVNLYSGFLSPAFSSRWEACRERLWRAVEAKRMTQEEAESALSSVVAELPRPPLSLVVDHVKHAIDVGGEDCAGLGGDLDGVGSLPVGIDGVADYPRIARLLGAGGLSSAQVEKVCHGNVARVFRDVMA